MVIGLVIWGFVMGFGMGWLIKRDTMNDYWYKRWYDTDRSFSRYIDFKDKRRDKR